MKDQTNIPKIDKKNIVDISIRQLKDYKDRKDKMKDIWQNFFSMLESFTDISIAFFEIDEDNYLKLSKASDKALQFINENKKLLIEDPDIDHISEKLDLLFIRKPKDRMTISLLSDKDNPFGFLTAIADKHINENMKSAIESIGSLILSEMEELAFRKIVKDRKKKILDILNSDYKEYKLQIDDSKSLNTYNQSLICTAVENAIGGFLITDNDGKILYINSYFEEITGYKRDEIIGKDISSIKDNDDMDGYQILTTLLEKISKKETWEGKVKKTDQERSLIYDFNITPIKDKKGQTVNFLALGKDISREEELETQLRRAQKMEAIGMMAGGIAHDFNNILTAVNGYAEIALDEVEDKNSSLYKDIKEIITASSKARELIRQILMFSRESTNEAIMLNLSTIIKESLKLLRSTIPSSVEIETIINTKSDLVMADPTQITQLIMNLATNAEFAMRTKGDKLTIKLENIAEDDNFFKIHPNANKKEYLKLIVKDNGPGIEQKLLERVFEPFFSTKTKNEGTGLGLFIVHGIVRSHNGFIDLESKPSEGTQITIYLPLAEDRREALKQDEQIKNEILQGRERILYIDDEPSITRITSRVLEKLGYNVKVYNDPVAAIEFFMNSFSEFDLVITDQTMPKITGIEIAKKVKEKNIPVILCTGYTNILAEKSVKEIGIDRLIGKPMTKGELSSAIREVLDKKTKN